MRFTNTINLKRLAVRMLWLCVLLVGSLPILASAQDYPQVDVSVSVSTTPIPFIPGGRSTVSLTVTNTGPDAAGSANPGPFAIDVIQNAFIITHMPPPYEIRDPVSGCFIMETISEPLPNGDIALGWEFYFDVILAGMSRTCTFDIEFYAFTVDDFTTGWLANPGYHETDSNLANNRVSYTFTAPLAPAAPTAVPAASSFLIISLAGSLLIFGWLRIRIEYQQSK